MLKSKAIAQDFQQAPNPPTTEELGDLRFRALLTSKQWQALPLAVRQRFSKRLAGLESVVYKGEVIRTQMNMLG